MPRLIDADALLREFPFSKDTNEKPLTSIFELGENAAIDYAVDVIKEAPTVDAEPVRHGHWRRITDQDHKGWALHECSECENEVNMAVGYTDPYCLYCGAKMDEEVSIDE